MPSLKHGGFLTAPLPEILNAFSSRPPHEIEAATHNSHYLKVFVPSGLFTQLKERALLYRAGGISWLDNCPLVSFQEVIVLRGKFIIAHTQK